MHLSNTMLDVLGTAPVEAVIIYTWSRVLHMRNRAAFYLLMSSCMLVVVLTRGDAHLLVSQLAADERYLRLNRHERQRYAIPAIT